jgi:hypothetical protein
MRIGDRLRMERKRAVSLYPGKTKCGIACWVVDDNCLRSVAVGSIPLETVRSLVARFNPDIVLIESERLETDPHQAGLITLPVGTKVCRCHPSWRTTYLPLPKRWGRGLGVYALNALKLGFSELFRRGQGLKLRDFKPVQYSGTWLEQWRRHGLKQQHSQS